MCLMKLIANASLAGIILLFSVVIGDRLRSAGRMIERHRSVMRNGPGEARTRPCLAVTPKPPAAAPPCGLPAKKI